MNIFQLRKSKVKKEEPVLSTDTKNDEASSPSDEERQPSDYENMYVSYFSIFPSLLHFISGLS
jgi:hypothetical protein